MFHVEQMIKFAFYLIMFCSLLVGCDKPNPHPEAMDPILADIESEIKATEDSIKSAGGELNGFLLDLKKIKPQTGQIKYAQKRVDETNSKLDKLKQMLQYWELKKKSRTLEARAAYLAAYKEKKPWPDPNEYKQYLIQKKLRQAPLNWDVKKRMEAAGVGIPIKAPGGTSGGPSGEHGDAPPAEKAAEHE